MSTLNERIAKAVCTYQIVVLSAQANARIAPDVLATYDLPPVNTIYLGSREYYEAIRDLQVSMPNGQGVQQVCGMTMIPVALDSYLQVAYVEGAQ